MKTNRIRYVLLSTVIMALFACQGEMSEQLEQLSGKPTTKAALVEATVKVETAGTFAAELNKVVAGGLKTVQKLTVSGKFDAEDVDSLQLMGQLEELDILNLAFVESEKTYYAYDGRWQVEVNTISPYLFYVMKKLSKVVLPNALIAIKRGAFEGCSALAEIKIPETVTLLDIISFYNCSNLSSIIIPNSVTLVGESAFNGCSNLSEVKLSESMESIIEGTFKDCLSLSSITIPNSVTSIGVRAFTGCSSLSDIKLPEALVSIGNEAFYNCTSLSSITIPNSVTTIGNSAFNSCVLEDVVLSNELISIGSDAFAYAYFETISLPDKLQTISDHAFSYNHKLKTITIPASVTLIGRGFITDCPNVSSIFWYSAEPVAWLRYWPSASEDCLLYLFSEQVDTSESYCSNIIVNGVAQKIVLKDGFPYRCLSPYKTKKISFTRNFRKATAPGSSSGWYTLALPFDVQTITYNSKDIAPFAKEVEDTNTKRFWLRELTATNYNKDVVAIKKDQPYIIAMPNSEAYDDEFNIRGEVTFSATNLVAYIDMPATPELPIIKGAEYSMTGTYEAISKKVSVYPINDAGNTFIPSLRAVSPFEAYVIDNDLSSAARSFSIGSSTGTRAFRPLSRKPSNDDM